MQTSIKAALHLNNESLFKEGRAKKASCFHGEEEAKIQTKVLHRVGV